MFRTMRAATLLRSPGPLEIHEIEIDEPRGREVLVRTAATGLCHSDYHLMRGRIARPLPSVLGHESAGIVEAIGPAVESVAVGDHVVCCLSVFCGGCRRCVAGETWLCERKAGTGRRPDEPPRLRLDGRPVQPFSQIGGLAELMLVHENATVAIPPDVPLERAAVLGCAVVAGIGAVLNAARLRPGETAAVLGCGGIGLNAVQGCVLAGASQIIAIDTNPAKLALARTFGATDTVDAAGLEPCAAAAAVRELTGGGVDHAFEAVGTKATVEAAFAMLRRGGHASVLGVLAEGTRIELDGAAFLASKTIRGVYMGSSRFKADLPVYLDWYRQGRLRLDELISHRLSLDEANDGYAALARGEVARAVVVFEGAGRR